MADLFDYITEEVQTAINLIATTMKQHNFGGTIEISPEEYSIMEPSGQQFPFIINHLNNKKQLQQESQIKVFDMITELNYSGSEFYPPSLVYQYNKNAPWKSQIQQVLKDIIQNRGLEAEQLQKYYHFGQLYKNRPASYHRQLRALKYELETTCGTRTITFHLRIANRVRKIFDKKDFNRLLCNIDISPSSIGRLNEEELEKILEQI